MVVKNVLDSQEFEGQGNQENIVGGVTALHNMESMPEVDPAAI